MGFLGHLRAGGPTSEPRGRSAWGAPGPLECQREGLPLGTPSQHSPWAGVGDEHTHEAPVAVNSGDLSGARNPHWLVPTCFSQPGPWGVPGAGVWAVMAPPTDDPGSPRPAPGHLHSRPRAGKGPPGSEAGGGGVTRAFLGWAGRAAGAAGPGVSVHRGLGEQARPGAEESGEHHCLCQEGEWVPEEGPVTRWAWQGLDSASSASIWEAWGAEPGPLQAPSVWGLTGEAPCPAGQEGATVAPQGLWSPLCSRFTSQHLRRPGKRGCPGL